MITRANVFAVQCACDQVNLNAYAWLRSGFRAVPDGQVAWQPCSISCAVVCRGPGYHQRPRSTLNNQTCIFPAQAPRLRSRRSTPPSVPSRPFRCRWVHGCVCCVAACMGIISHGCLSAHAIKIAIGAQSVFLLQVGAWVGLAFGCGPACRVPTAACKPIFVQAARLPISSWPPTRTPAVQGLCASVCAGDYQGGQSDAS